MIGDIFNNHFVEQCSLMNNESALPYFVSRCNSSLSEAEMTGEKMLSIIRSLDPKIPMAFDDFSINMVKICDIEVIKPLYLIYLKYMKCLKKANVLPIHKIENRHFYLFAEK